MIKYLKNNYPNIYVIIISISIVIWFYSITGLIQKFTNNSKRIEVYITLIIISLSIMYFDDFSFSELYDMKGNKAAAAAAAVRAHQNI
jgi:hypothetical protein